MRGINQISTRPVKSFAYSSPYIYPLDKFYSKPIPPIIIGAQGKVKTKRDGTLPILCEAPSHSLKTMFPLHMKFYGRTILS